MNLRFSSGRSEGIRWNEDFPTLARWKFLPTAKMFIFNKNRKAGKAKSSRSVLSQADQCFSQVTIIGSSTYIGCRFVTADRNVLFDVGDNFVQLLLDAFLLDLLVSLKKDTKIILTPSQPCIR